MELFSKEKSNRLLLLQMLLRLVVLSLGSLHVWAAIASHSMNEDGISYLDMGDAYFKGDWGAAVNSVWSPMYSWILGFVMWATEPSMEWEFAVVHIMNLVIFGGTLVCFEFFWHQIMRYHRSGVNRDSPATVVGLPAWALCTLGYLIFIIGSLHLIEIWAVTPDLLMSAFVYLSAGIVVRLRSGIASGLDFLLLGLFLGLGYLAKAVMLPLAFVFLGVTFFSVKEKKVAALGVGCALSVFLVLTLPYVALISSAKGRVTFGDAGKLTYAKYVNYVQYPHWQGDSHGNGTPHHPSRKIFDSPPIYEFGAPIGGTYPISYDPAYWYEGLVARFDLRNQINALLASIQFYIDLFVFRHGGLLFGIAALYLLGRMRQARAGELVQQWGLLLPSAAALGFYALVSTEGRYVGVFAVLLWSDLLANVRLSDSEAHRRLSSVLSGVMILFLVINIGAFNLEGLRKITGKGPRDPLLVKQTRSPSWPGEVAIELHKVGLKQGDKAAVIGYAFDSYWARLARVKIVAEMLGWQADSFWFGGPEFQTRVIEVFRSTGARAVVAEEVPTHAKLGGWHQVSDTDYYVYVFGRE